MHESESDASKSINQIQAPDVNTSGVWAERAHREIEAMTEMPRALRADIIRSLDTPQFGPYHNEGLRMGNHIGLMMERVDAIIDDSFDFVTTGLPEEYQQEARDIVTRGLKTQGKEQMKRYASIHDVKKPDCMSVSFVDERPDELWTMVDWDQLVAEAAGDEDRIRQILQERGIKKIGYRQDKSLTGGEDKEHGEEAVAYLDNLAQNDSEMAKFVRENALIIKGVGNHEIHFQVFNTARSAKQYFGKLLKSEDKIGIPKFTDEEIDFIYAACFIDIASSLQNNGSGDYSGFKNMLEARKCYHKIQQFKESRDNKGKPLRDNEIGALMGANGFENLIQQIDHLEKPPAPTSLSPEQSDLIFGQLDALLKQLSIDSSKKVEIEGILNGEYYMKVLGQKGFGKLAGAIRKLLA